MVRTILVTGAASGIGAAAVTALRGQGADVITGDAVAGDVPADLATSEGRRALVAGVRDRAGRLDAVLCCAGVRRGGADTISVNYFGAVGVLVELRDQLLSSPAPRAVVVSSLAAVRLADEAVVAAALDGDEAVARDAAQACLEGERGGALLYASSKVALARWVRRSAARPEWGGAGILLNAVAPGLVDTPMIGALAGTDAARAELLRREPNIQGRVGRPAEVADVLAWLSSADNSCVLGQVIYVDLGREAQLRPEHVREPAP
jgi:NAD(P)-dependent dehydrogenase (short-subunit alcohol dehydrogenase family)